MKPSNWDPLRTGDKGIGNRQETFILWRWLLSRIRERYSFKDDLIGHPSKWNAMEKGTRCLKELAVLDAIYKDSNNKQPRVDPYDVQCTQLSWFRNGNPQFRGPTETLNCTATRFPPFPLPLSL